MPPAAVLGHGGPFALGKGTPPPSRQWGLSTVHSDCVASKPWACGGPAHPALAGLDKADPGWEGPKARAEAAGRRSRSPKGVRRRGCLRSYPRFRGALRLQVKTQEKTNTGGICGKAEKVMPDKALRTLKRTCAGVVQRTARELFSVDNSTNLARSPMNTAFAPRELFSVDNFSCPQYFCGQLPLSLLCE